MIKGQQSPTKTKYQNWRNAQLTEEITKALSEAQTDPTKKDSLIELIIEHSPTKIAGVIKAHRMLANMSQQDLATQINALQQNVGLWERGKVLPILPNIMKLQEILNIDFKWLK